MSNSSADIFKPNHTSFNTMTAVVVDDVDNMRTTMSALLLEAGLKKVYQAADGVDALSIIQKHQIDLVVSELQIARLDGIELLRKVRSDPKISNTPFIMTSATIEENDVVRAIKHGVSEYVVKPFSAKILIERTKRAIAHPIKSTASLFKRGEKSAKGTVKENLRILVVDDEATNIQIISELLKNDYRIKAATNGELALKICASAQPPDLVLLDVMMPQMDGIEVCKRLKSNARTQHIAVIFLTALDQTEDIVKGLALGAVDYIVKPINPPVVKARVKTHSKVIEAHKQMREQVDTLVEMTRLKEEYDRVVKSDLKHPIEAITQSVAVLEKGFRDPTRVKQNAMAIKSSITQLTQMVDNMLTLGKIEEGNYQLVPVRLDLRHLMTTVVETFQLTFAKKKLEIHNDVVEAIYIEAEELLSISLFSNLIKNAIEAAPRGSAIKLSGTIKDNCVVVEIHNQGEIPEEIQGRFFDKYVTSGKKNATGIGTYAAKLMAEVQNGKIDFRSGVDEGTSLYISLPKF